MNDLINDQIIKRSDLRELFGVTTNTVRVWQKEGKLPEPDFKLSERVTGWRLSTLRAHGVNIPWPMAS